MGYFRGPDVKHPFTDCHLESVPDDARLCEQCFCPITDEGDRFCSDQCEVANDRQLGPDSDKYTTDVYATPIDKEDA